MFSTSKSDHNVPPFTLLCSLYRTFSFCFRGEQGQATLKFEFSSYFCSPHVSHRTQHQRPCSRSSEAGWEAIHHVPFFALTVATCALGVITISIPMAETMVVVVIDTGVSATPSFVLLALLFFSRLCWFASESHSTQRLSYSGSSMYDSSPCPHSQVEPAVGPASGEAEQKLSQNCQHLVDQGEWSNEVLLQENPMRFVLFPINHDAIWHMYKKVGPCTPPFSCESLPTLPIFIVRLK